MINIKDRTGFLNPDTVTELQGKSWPFDINVGIGSFASRGELDAATGRMVDAPRVLAIGLDPGHRYISVHFGTGLHIPSSQHDEIRAAGNSYFRAGNWGAGIAAISAKTDSVMAQAQVVVPSQSPPAAPHQDSSSGAVWWVLGGVILIAAALSVFLIWRSRKRDQEAAARLAELDSEIETHRDLNYNLDDFDRRLMGTSPRVAASARGGFESRPKERYAVPAPVAPVASQPVIVQNNGGNDMLTGLLIGNMLSSHDTHHHHHDDSSYSSGGSSSTFDDSPSFDSGGSTSDFGSSGSDFGGGGFDGGGSSGDF